MPKIKISKTTVDKIPLPEGERVDYFDTDLTGFGVRASKTAKTYFVMARVNGKLIRHNIGRHGVVDPDRARKKAKSVLGDMTDGIDPNQEKAKSRERGLTLKEIHEKYQAARPQMKRHTVQVDKSLLNCHMSDWLNKPIQEITKEMVAKRHLKIAQETKHVTANNAMRLFRRLYNFAIGISEEDSLPKNPVARLSDTRQWFKESRRQTVIKDHELHVWYSALQKIDSPVAQDYLELLLFTGLRKNEGLTLKWSDVDMKGKTFTVRETKNGKPHTLPMSTALFDLFTRRQELRENEYVFPGREKKTPKKNQKPEEPDHNKDRHLIEPKRQVQNLESITQLILNNVETVEELEKLKKENPDKVMPGITFCLHDLRRTFSTIAEQHVSYSELKRLMNHTDKDVTQGYLVISVEKLKDPMQRVTNAIKKLLEPKSTGKVIQVNFGQ